MNYYSLPSQYDHLMDDLQYHFANVEAGDQIVVVSYIMPCDAILAMVDEAKSRGVRTIIAVDAQHALPGATPVRCHGSEAMHAKYIVAGETVIAGSWNFGKRGGVESVFIQESSFELALELTSEAESMISETQFMERVHEEVATIVPRLGGSFGRSIRKQIARRGTLSGPQIAAILDRR